jgi:hypothetical protein
MATVGTNRRWRGMAGLVVASALSGSIALGVARWPDIQFELGYAYENGNFHGWSPGFARDDRKAAHWLGRAAQANHPRAQYMMGILHAHGWGVPRDGRQAVAWFSRSARNGYAPACYHLGWMYHKGDDVPKDDDRAIRLLRQAAGEGMAAAHLALGRFHEHGEGVPADTVQALKRYVLAVHFARSRPELFDNATVAAEARVAHDALAARTDPSSAGQAQALASQWLANPSTNRASPH